MAASVGRAVMGVDVVLVVELAVDAMDSERVGFFSVMVVVVAVFGRGERVVIG